MIACVVECTVLIQIGFKTYHQYRLCILVVVVVVVHISTSLCCKDALYSFSQQENVPLKTNKNDQHVLLSSALFYQIFCRRHSYIS